MRVADLVTALLFGAVSALVLFDSIRIGIGWGSDGPKSGFFPFWLGVLLLVTSAAIFAQAFRRVVDTPFATRKQLRPVASVLLPAIVLVVLTHVAGLYVAAALYMAVYMRWIGRHRWPTIALVAVGVPIVTFMIFEQWFLVPMPKGPLEAWLGY